MAAPMKGVFALARNILVPLTKKNNGCLLLRRFSVATNTAQLQSQPFALYSGLIIERRPVITAEPTDLEKRYETLQNTIELECSYFSKHEIRHQVDTKLASHKQEEGGEDREQSVLTAVDMEDIWTEEGSKFTAAPRTTDADGTGNTKTHHRHLDKCLYLLVKQSFSADTSHWVFPQALSPDGESTRETTVRILRDLSDSLTVKYLGNAPCTHYKLMYPKSSVTNEAPTVGAKIFLHKALVHNGDVTALAEDTEYKDFCWATLDEVKLFVSKSYWKAVKPVLHQH